MVHATAARVLVTAARQAAQRAATPTYSTYEWMEPTKYEHEYRPHITAAPRPAVPLLVPTSLRCRLRSGRPRDWR